MELTTGVIIRVSTEGAQTVDALAQKLDNLNTKASGLGKSASGLDQVTTSAKKMALSGADTAVAYDKLSASMANLSAFSRATIQGYIDQAKAISETTTNLEVQRITLASLRNGLKGFISDQIKQGEAGAEAANVAGTALGIVKGQMAGVQTASTAMAGATKLATDATTALGGEYTNLGRIFLRDSIGPFGARINLLNESLLSTPVLLAAAGAAFTLLAGVGIKAAASMNEMANQTGVSTEDLSALQVAATQSGASLTVVASAIEHMSRTVDEAIQGQTGASSIMERLGLTDAQLRHDSPVQLLSDIAAAIAKIPDPLQRAAMAQDVFGASGKSLLPVLQTLAKDGFDATRAKADELGVTISTQTAQQAEVFTSQLELTKLKLEAVGATIASPLLDLLDALAKAVNFGNSGWVQYANTLGLVVVAAKAVGIAASGLKNTTSNIFSPNGNQRNGFGSDSFWDNAAQNIGLTTPYAAPTVTNRPAPPVDTTSFVDAMLKAAAAAAEANSKYAQMFQHQQNILSAAQDQLAVLNAQARAEAAVDDVEKLRLTHVANLLQIQKQYDANIRAIEPGSPVGGQLASVYGQQRSAAITGEDAKYQQQIADLNDKDDATLASIESHWTKILDKTTAKTVLDARLNALGTDYLADLQKVLSLQTQDANQTLINVATLTAGYAAAYQDTINKSIEATLNEDMKGVDKFWTEVLAKSSASNREMFKNLDKDLLAYYQAQSAATNTFIAGTVQAIHDGTVRAMEDIFSGKGIKDALGNFATLIQQTLAKSVGAGLTSYLDNLMKTAHGVPTLQYVNGTLQPVTPTKDQQSSAQTTLSIVAGAGAAYGLYENGQKGVSKAQNAISGIAQGAAIGTSIEPGVGTIIGAIVGGIAGWLTGSSNTNKNPTGRVDYSTDVGVTFPTNGPYGAKNLSVAEIADFSQRVEAVATTYMNEYVNVLLTLPGKTLALLPKLAAGTNFGTGQEMQDWLSQTLPKQLEAQVTAAWKSAFVAAGVGSAQFDNFVKETQAMSADDALKFWTDLANGISSFADANSRMQDIAGLNGNWASANLGADGTQQGFGMSDFTEQVSQASTGLFRIATQLVDLSGPDQVAAFQALGEGVDQITRSLTDYINQIGQTLRQLKSTFDSAYADHALQKAAGDPNAQAAILYGEYQRIVAQIQGASTNGLSASDVSALTSQGIGLLNQIYNLDPSAAMDTWWQSQMGQLQSAATSALGQMASDAQSAVARLISELQPFKDWFLGLPVDLGAAVNLAEGAFPGFAAALDALTAKINGVVLTPPTTTPGNNDNNNNNNNDDRNGAHANSVTSGDINVTVQVNGAVVGVPDIATVARDAVIAAIRNNPSLIKSSYAYS